MKLFEKVDVKEVPKETNEKFSNEYIKLKSAEDLINRFVNSDQYKTDDITISNTHFVKFYNYCKSIDIDCDLYQVSDIKKLPENVECNYRILNYLFTNCNIDNNILKDIYNNAGFAPKYINVLILTLPSLNKMFVSIYKDTVLEMNSGSFKEVFKICGKVTSTNKTKVTSINPKLFF